MNSRIRSVSDEELESFMQHLSTLFDTEEIVRVVDSCAHIHVTLVNQQAQMELKKQPQKTGFEGLFAGKSFPNSSRPQMADRKHRLIHRKAMTRR